MAFRGALRRPHAIALAAAAAASIFAATLGAPAHATGNRLLYAQVGTQDSPDAFAISLTDSAGQPVKRLAAGSYDVQADDWSGIHNFDLLQAGLSVFSTNVETPEHTSATLALDAQSSTFRCDAHVTTMKGAFTVVSALAADGSGAFTPSVSALPAGSGKTLTFTYTAASGGLGGGAVTLTVPAGWSPPSTTGSAPGFVTSSAGSVSISGQTITVPSLSPAGGGSFTVTYGSKALAGPGAPVSAGASQSWQAQERSTSDGTLTDLASSPRVAVVSQDGSGAIAPAAADAVSAGATGRTVSFDYTAAAGGLSGGSVSLAVPTGWSTPSTTSTAAGYVTSSAGSVSVSGQTATVSSLSLGAGETVRVSYGVRTQGGPGATAPSATGAQTWAAREASTTQGTLTSLASSPQISVVSADGSGAITTPTAFAGNHYTHNTVSFTYTAAQGGVEGGAVKLVVPSGWSVPSTSELNGGYTTASAGTVSTASRTILVSGITLGSGGQFTLVYGSRAGGGPGATSPSVGGMQTWASSERSTAAGTLKALSSVKIDVLAPDGSGTTTTPTASVVHQAPHQTVVFTYTAASGGTFKGSVTIAVPPGWSAPSTSPSAPGFSASSRGSLSISSRTIVVSGLGLAAGTRFTIGFGLRTSGGPGAAAPSVTGSQSWTTRERSWTGGLLHALAASPSITVS
jgi:hypothetical protein